MPAPILRRGLAAHRPSSPATIAPILALFAAMLGTSRTASAADKPCDIFKAGGTPCIAAHSTVRALYGAYDGDLYTVRRSSDNTTKNIPTLSPGGAANSAIQDAFCKGTSCVITILFDQSGHGNFMEYQGAGSSVTGSAAPANATNEQIDFNGSKVYSLYIKPGNTYWRDGHLTGVPTGSAPEGMYMVTSGTHYNGGCCFDYGNSETTRKADAAGAMDAIYFGNSCWFKDGSHPNYQCNTGTGPWVQADLEWGLFAWNSSNTWNPSQVSFRHKFVTAMLKNNGTTRFAIKGANAQTGNLTKLWDGALPSGYNPMKKQGAIVLGSGGDCCRAGGGVNQSEGTFYEGAIVAGYPTDSVEEAVQANVASSGYGSSVPVGVMLHLAAAPTAALRFDPTSSTASLDYSLDKGCHVRLSVVDIRGHVVATLVDASISRGRHTATWNTSSAHAGMYAMVLESEGRKDWTGEVLVSR